MPETVLIIEDEPDALDLVVYHFKKAGYHTLTARDGASGLTKARDLLPALVVLDLMLPQMDGTEVCKRLKADPRTAHIPIIMLTAKAEEVDRILGLELGADDYVTKPFSPRELVLRAKKILERAKGVKPLERLTHGDLVVDLAKHEVTCKGRVVELTATEFKLLATLMERRGRVQTRDRLLTDVWGYEGQVDTRTVDTHIRRLREKLGKLGELIETVRGVGYRFAD
ncbi:MAG: winged helix-turn-helix domain-containing protein [Verrucomicrobiae bacterium]|nr:winged helix-turn-helix domain-containing protein [Verrucomicrobiae bacterium]